jgi:iron complex transport system substrate-binding protein
VFSVRQRQLVSAICALGLHACAQEPRDDAASASSTSALEGPQVVDHFGDTLPPAANYARIVSLTPATTEILFALGAGSRLVGRGEYDKWPDAALAVPNLGPGLRPNVEAVLAARPDIVFLYASADNRAAAQRLRQAGVPTAAFKVDSIEQFERTTRLLGVLIGLPGQGTLVADTVRRTLDSVRALTRGRPVVRVVMPAFEDPLLVIGGGSFMSQLVEIAGGRNVYGDIAQPSPAVTFEDLVQRNPEVVLTGPEHGMELLQSPRWKTLDAVRRGRVLFLDTSVTMRPAVRLGEGAVSIARLLHPELTSRP